MNLIKNASNFFPTKIHEIKNLTVIPLDIITHSIAHILTHNCNTTLKTVTDNYATEIVSLSPLAHTLIIAFMTVRLT